MPGRRLKVLLILGVLCVACAGGLVVWWNHARSFAPSALIADADLSGKLRDSLLPHEYQVLVRKTAWNHNSGERRFERSFECTVLRMDNAPVDPSMVGERLDAWVGGLVPIGSTDRYATGPAEVSRLILYEAERTTGELRYSIKPVPGATLTVNGKESPGNFLSLDIQITERKKP